VTTTLKKVMDTYQQELIFLSEYI